MTRRRSSVRVAVVGTSLDILGGQGVQGRRLIEGLAQEGLDVEFVPINPRFPRALAWLRRIPVARTLLNQLIYLPSLWRLSNADVVHIFSGSYWSFLLAPVPAMLVARVLGKHVVLNYHSGEADDHLSRWGSLVHPWLRLADEIVVPSRYLQVVFDSYGYRTRVVENIVDLSRFQYRDRRPLRPRVLSTRNLEPYYRVDLVIRAFAQFRQQVPDATLTVAGYGREERTLEELARSLDCGGIHFAGRIDPDDMPALYADHDIFVNASVLDNQPVSILEAFASGLPVVSTAAGDIPFMMRNGETGILAIPGSEAIAAAIGSVWNDAGAALTMARRANAAVGRFTWSAVREQWLDVYSVRRGLDEIAIGAESR